MCEEKERERKLKVMWLGVNFLQQLHSHLMLLKLKAKTAKTSQGLVRSKRFTWWAGWLQKSYKHRTEICMKTPGLDNCITVNYIPIQNNNLPQYYQPPMNVSTNSAKKYCILSLEYVNTMEPYSHCQALSNRQVGWYFTMCAKPRVDMRLQIHTIFLPAYYVLSLPPQNVHGL